MKKYNIAVIGGDGIGPEVIGEAITLLKITGTFSKRKVFSPKSER